MSAQITYEDVATAAENLRAEGRPIGPTKVREMLGRGSFTTVQKYLSEWESVQTELKTKAEEEKRSGPPEEMFTELQKVMAAYWPQAVARAKEELRPETEALNAKLSEALSRNKESTLEIGNLENALELASVKAARAEEAEKRAAEANLKIISLQHELSRLEKIESRYEAQKQLVTTLQDQTKTLKEQNTLLSKKADDLAAALRETERKFETASMKAARMEEAEKRVQDGAKQILELQVEMSRLEKGEARADAQMRSLQDRNKSLSEEAELLRKEFKEATIKIVRLETRLEVQEDKRK